MRHMRLFIALPVSAEVQSAAVTLISDMRKIPGGVKWVRPELLHITLKFLGNTPAEKIDAIEAALRQAATDISSFTLSAIAGGAFPNLKRPRVFWLGLDSATTQPLLMLQKQVERQLTAIGFPAEARPFRPHLTIGRLKNPKNLDALSQAFADYPFQPIRFAVEKILLMRSELGPAGPAYFPERTITLPIGYNR